MPNYGIKLESIPCADCGESFTRPARWTRTTHGQPVRCSGCREVYKRQQQIERRKGYALAREARKVREEAERARKAAYYAANRTNVPRVDWAVNRGVRVLTGKKRDCVRCGEPFPGRSTNAQLDLCCRCALSGDRPPVDERWSCGHVLAKNV